MELFIKVLGPKHSKPITLNRFQRYTKALVVITLVVLSTILVKDIKSLKPSTLRNPVHKRNETFQLKSAQEVKLQPKHLGTEILDKVEALLLFIGYSRSGHTLIGSLLDAHPHVVIANEYNILLRWPTLTAKQRTARYLFDQLYQNSYIQFAKGYRSPNKLIGRSYFVPNQWQGRYKDTIKVIGDKKGGRTTRMLASNKKLLKNISKSVDLPIKIIHVVRNPFDNIATMTLRKLKIKTNKEELVKNPVNDSRTLKACASHYINIALANMRLMQSLSNVFTLHSENVIKKPKQALQRLCHFLELTCTKDYLKDCTGIIYTKPSKSRLTMIWPPELKEAVLKKIQSIPFLKMYSFDT